MRKTRKSSKSKEKEPEMQTQRYQFRKRVHKSIFQSHNLKQGDLNSQDLQDYDEFHSNIHFGQRRHRKKRNSKNRDDNDQLSHSPDDCEQYDQVDMLGLLPKTKSQLNRLKNVVSIKIKDYKEKFLKQQAQSRSKISYVGENSIPISTDITKFNFDLLAQKQLDIGNRLFDVIMMDPPWKLSSSKPSRGVAIQYDSLGDEIISAIPIQKLQKNGFLMIWAINAKFRFTVDVMEKKWGYKIIDTITWVKMTVNGKIAKSHGYYLQHAKQTCIIGIKGKPIYKQGVARDVIFSERRGQSQKPTQIYDYIEELVPNGYYLQIFGRRNNLRNKWVTIGNQI